ncbi:MAG: FmdB family zinc ribbon protein [Candidatus Binatia bacterium]
MPIYEYACDKCGVFETTQRITEQPLKKCPTCKGKVKKLMSSTSFQLKGTGWYVTDYGGKKGADGDAKGGGKDSGKDSAKESGSSSESASSSSEGTTGGAASESKTKEKSKSKKDTAAKAA